ncbi:MAG: DUF1835 domain-containing protein [Nannocystaceae bacterium]
MRRLHLRCGSDLRDALSCTDWTGDFLEWSDPVCQGPIDAEWGDDTWVRRRAQFLSRGLGGGGTPERIAAQLRAQLDALERISRYDEVILWFEHDLYDQAILCRLLSRLRDREGLRGKLQLLSLDRHPDVPRFIGFGQLRPQQLAALRGTERLVRADQFDLAHRAWVALCADDPRNLQQLALQEGGSLPFLAGALTRHLQEFPSLVHGLSLTEALLLRAYENGATTPVEAFQQLTASLDPQPFLGDAMCWPIFRRLAEGTRPALSSYRGPREAQCLTAYGQRLAAGEGDWVRDHGLARDLGGVRLRGKRVPWRWDPDAGALVIAD